MRRLAPWGLAVAALTIVVVLVIRGSGDGDGEASASRALQAGLMVGFNDTLPSVAPRFPLGLFVGRMRAAGAQLHRMSLSWQYEELERGRPDEGYFGRWDELYRRELDAGVRQVIQLVGTPVWALGTRALRPDGSRACSGDPRALCLAPPDVRDPVLRAAWQQWVQRVVRRYPQAAAIEVWNEPNQELAWVVAQDPALYARLVQATSEAVEGVDPRMVVLAGSTAAFDGPDSPTATSVATFLKTLFRVAGNGAFDAISYHSYPCPGPAPTRRLDLDLARVRAVRDAAGVDTMALWLTETGAATGRTPTAANCGGAFGHPGQARALAATIDWATGVREREGDLRTVLVNTLFNQRPSAVGFGRPLVGDVEFGLIAWRFGVEGPKLVPKPGLRVVACRFGASSMC